MKNPFQNFRAYWQLLGKQGQKLVTRTVSASIMFPIGLYSVWRGGGLLQVVTGVLMATAALEWCGMIEKDRQQPDLSGSILAISALLAVFVVAYWPQYFLELIAVTMVTGILSTRRARAEMVFASVYIVCPAPAFFIVREQAAYGKITALALFMTVIMVDVAAYFGGKSFGGARLLPSVSPAKTWAGAFSGLAGAALVGAGFALWSDGDMLHWASWTILIGIVAQAGDLLESLFKRRFKVKDSSNLLPGHGGVLDRIDGLMAISLFAATVFLLYPDLIPQPGAF